MDRRAAHLCQAQQEVSSPCQKNGKNKIHDIEKKKNHKHKIMHDIKKEKT
jgi:hypothetical protein